jgi:hypothetical protein
MPMMEMMKTPKTENLRTQMKKIEKTNSQNLTIPKNC